MYLDEIERLKAEYIAKKSLARAFFGQQEVYEIAARAYTATMIYSPDELAGKVELYRKLGAEAAQMAERLAQTIEMYQRADAWIPEAAHVA
jgi:hypothetical protein